MPRRNKPIKHTPFHMPANDAAKKRYPSQQMAQRAAEDRMLMHPELDLTVYQGLDGGWYLTRVKASDTGK